MHPVHVIESVSRTQDQGGTVAPQRLSAAEIADDIRDRINSGEYPPGSRLPSHPKLAELYDVHYATIQRAMTILRVRGDVRGEQGRGVFVPDEDN